MGWTRPRLRGRCLTSDNLVVDDAALRKLPPIPRHGMGCHRRGERFLSRRAAKPSVWPWPWGSLGGSPNGQPSSHRRSSCRHFLPTGSPRHDRRGMRGMDAVGSNAPNDRRLGNRASFEENCPSSCFRKPELMPRDHHAVPSSSRGPRSREVKKKKSFPGPCHTPTSHARCRAQTTATRGQGRKRRHRA